MRRLSNVRTIFCALGCLGAMACSAQGPDSETVGTVSQQLAPGVYALMSAQDDTCVEVTGAALNNGANIATAACTGEAHQQWQFVERPDGSFRIANVNSGKCMRAAGDAGGNVQQGRCIYKRSKWMVDEQVANEIQLTSVKNAMAAQLMPQGPPGSGGDVVLRDFVEANLQQTFLAAPLN